MPARIVGTAARRADLRGALTQFLQFRDGGLDLVFASDDAHEVAHRLLDLGVDRVRVLAADSLKRGERLSLRLGQCRFRDRRPRLAGV